MSKAGWGAALVLGVWYLLTMARGLMFFDAGEFALVAQQWGLGHPPGQPLYTVLLGTFARLPGLDPLTGMNGLSAVSAALCAIPADALLRRVGDISGKVRFLSLLAVGALAPIWDQATRIELYSTSTFLLLWLLAAGARAVENEDTSIRRWLGLGMIAGALAGVNAVVAIAGAVGVGFYAGVRLILADPKGLLRSGAAAALGGVALVGLTYAYVYAVHDATDRFVWGTWDRDGAVAYLTGADYAHTAQGDWGEVPGHAFEWAEWLLWQGALPVVLIGFVACFATRARRFLPLVFPPMLAGAYFTFSYGDAFYPQVPDYNGYLAPLMWLSVLGLGALLSLRPKLGVPAGIVLLGFCLIGDRPVWERTRAPDRVAEDLAQTWLEGVPENGIAVLSSDHLVFPAWYMHEVAGVRPDIVLINEGFAASSWYWRYLFQRYPDLPRISLAAPNTGVRLAHLARASGKTVAVESPRIAASMQLKPCSATWGMRVGDCEPADDPAAFEAKLAEWRGQSEGLITPRVLANLGRTRAEVRWFFGDVSGALRALRASVGRDLPVPEGLRGPRPAPPLPRPTGLIGSTANNIALGAALLDGLGHADTAGWTQ